MRVFWLGKHSVIKEFAADTNICGRMKHFYKVWRRKLILIGMKFITAVTIWVYLAFTEASSLCVDWCPFHANWNAHRLQRDTNCSTGALVVSPLCLCHWHATCDVPQLHGHIAQSRIHYREQSQQQRLWWWVLKRLKGEVWLKPMVFSVHTTRSTPIQPASDDKLESVLGFDFF